MLRRLRQLLNFRETAHVIRSPEEQEKIETLSKGLTLFQYAYCPYCERVRRVVRKRELSLEQMDVLKSDDARAQLLIGGGKFQVPCLRIQQDNGEVQWLYESGDIIRFLERRFTLRSDAF